MTAPHTAFSGGRIVDAAVAVLRLTDTAVGERVTRVVRVRAVVLSGGGKQKSAWSRSSQDQWKVSQMLIG